MDEARTNAFHQAPRRFPKLYLQSNCPDGQIGPSCIDCGVARWMNPSSVFYADNEYCHYCEQGMYGDEIGLLIFFTILY